ncbi:MAG: aminotransferase class V-fold PLP-dependent enzyme [Clostridiales bacterium]|jgi:cysteine desulfurase family protein|nr:aminotransferase class V-fold PLP-dependent enzyme [Clostridiales bacterium]
MIYLDYAATSYKKPASVLKELGKSYASAGRGGHKMALEASNIVYETRASIAQLFNIDNPSQIAFMNNTTDALNTAIKGVVRAFDHIIISGMEHNSVARPAYSMDCDVTVVPPNKFGVVEPDEVRKAIRDNTRLIVMTHASNICGSVNDIKAIGDIASSNGVIFLVDAAQSAGVVDIDVVDMHIDMLAFPGHKMLYGPQGTGALYVREGLDIKPLKEGGTGSASEDLLQPTFMPDTLESGTLNVAGISAFGEGVRFVSKIGVEQIREHEAEHTKSIIEGLKNISGVTVYGLPNEKGRVGVVGFNIDGYDCNKLCNRLSVQHDIATRGGLHCSALGHKSMGTIKVGMARASVGWWTKSYEIDKFLTAVRKIAEAERDN